MEESAGLIGGINTPRYAKILSWKYSCLPAEKVSEDMRENHLRDVSSSHVQHVSYAVSDLISQVENTLEYSDTVDDKKVFAVSVGRDGAMVRTRDGGFREAMVGTLSLLDKSGDVLHTVYVGEGPEYGRASFDQRLSREISRLKDRFPDGVALSSVADGAAHNWTFLEREVDWHIIDWWHAWEYIYAALSKIHQGEQLVKVVKHWKSKLRKEDHSVYKLLDKLRKVQSDLSKEGRRYEEIDKAVTYLSNHADKMNYSYYIEQGLMIGSGVTESACKTLIKNRFCGCGMKWEVENISKLVRLRSLVLTKGRWEQTWEHLTARAA